MKLLTSILILQMLCQLTYGQDAESTQKENAGKELEQQFFPIHKLIKDFHFNFSTPFSEVTIATEDGFNLNGLLFKVKQPKGLIFYLHGSNDAVDVWGKISPTYNELHYDIFILDYRGYGKSEGIVTNERQLSCDVQIAYNKLKENY